MSKFAIVSHSVCASYNCEENSEQKKQKQKIKQVNFGKPVRNSYICYKEILK